MSTEQIEDKKAAEKAARQAVEDQRATKSAASTIEEIKRLSKYEISSNEDPQYILACLRVLGFQYCMEPRGRAYSNKDVDESGYIIRFSQTYVDSLIKDVEEALKNYLGKEDRYSFYEGNLYGKFRDDFESARQKCEGLIRHLRLQAQDEAKVREERIRTEEEIRNNYRRRY